MEEKSKYLWHGSPKKIEGDMLLPRKGRDIRNVPENVQVGVYASDNKDIAIAMALVKCVGMVRGGLYYDKTPIQGIAYEGWPAQEQIYVYKLSSNTFRQSGGERQWVSSEPVTYVNIEEIPVKDVIHLLRKPTYEEKINYERQFGVKLKD